MCGVGDFGARRMSRCLLGVNCDHIATLREARGGAHPDVMRALPLLKKAGADGVTVHLREDRRHIHDDDVAALCKQNLLPINLEMAATDEMERIALRHAPAWCCIVPEGRHELTTEGGLDVMSLRSGLAQCVARLQDGGIKVSLFIEPDFAQIKAAADIKADAVELHTGALSLARGDDSENEWRRIEDAARMVAQTNLLCHGGHGLTYDNVSRLVALPMVREVNIGHFLVGESVFVGLFEAVRRMRQLIDGARS